jgi:hypothetical protein
MTHPARAGLGGDLRTGLGPRPPCRPLIPGGIAASTLARASRPERRLSPNTSRGFTSQGLPASRRASLSVDSGLSPLAPLAQGACVKLVHTRTRELLPSSIHSSTPCHGLAASSAGESEPGDRRPAGARPRSQRFRLANPGFANRNATAEEPGFAGPRTTCSRRPPATATRCSREVPANRTVRHELACASHAETPGTVGRPNCSRSPTTLGLGLASHAAPRRATRSAIPEVPSIDELPAS